MVQQPLNRNRTNDRALFQAHSGRCGISVGQNTNG